MILVVKKWAQHVQINDASKGTLSSYALVLMVLHYLQSQYIHSRFFLHPIWALTCFEAHHECIVFFPALKEPVLPSLQKDFPVSVFVIYN